MGDTPAPRATSRRNSLPHELSPGDPLRSRVPPLGGGSLERALWPVLKGKNAHSIFLSFAALIFTATLVLDLVLHREAIDPRITLLLLLGTAALGSAAFYFGKRVPLWVGMTAICLFALASLFFLSPLGDTQSAVSTLQELPILALYLAWFVRPRRGRIIMSVALGCFALMCLVNPAFAPDGQLGPSPAVQGLLVAFCCFEIGSVLWRRSQSLASVDPLTGALTRLAFMERLETELLLSQRTNTPMVLVVIDFDRFKELNDTLGHAAGDAALSETVASWRRNLRFGDFVGRTGGDEFAVVLRGAGRVEAHATMQRLLDGGTHPWSWGSAQARAEDDVEALFQRADGRLYDVKRSRS